MDPFAEAFDQIGADFEELMPTVNVTVRQIDPDSQNTTTTAASVPALKRSRRRQPFAVSGNGEVGGDQCRFVFKVGRVSWVLKARDEIEEADGTVWKIDSVQLLAFNQLAGCDVTRKRG